MKIELKTASSAEERRPDHLETGSGVRFVEAYPKAGPVLQGSYIFPKVESYGVWNIKKSSGTVTVPEDC